jgi:hypothetical protein
MRGHRPQAPALWAMRLPQLWRAAKTTAKTRQEIQEMDQSQKDDTRRILEAAADNNRRSPAAESRRMVGAFRSGPRGERCLTHHLLSIDERTAFPGPSSKIVRFPTWEREPLLDDQQHQVMTIVLSRLHCHGCNTSAERNAGRLRAVNKLTFMVRSLACDCCFTHAGHTDWASVSPYSPIVEKATATV